jgi:hypothetical protein
MKAFLEKKTIKMIDHNGEVVEQVVLMGKDEATQKYLNRRKDMQVLVTDIKQARNYGNHKRMFDFVNAVFDMQDIYTNDEIFRNWLTVAAGWFNIMMYPDGTTQFFPKSWKFEEMDEEEFNRMFSAAIDAVLADERITKGMSESDLMRIVSYG